MKTPSIFRNTDQASYEDAARLERISMHGHDARTALADTLGGLSLIPDTSLDPQTSLQLDRIPKARKYLAQFLQQGLERTMPNVAPVAAARLQPIGSGREDSTSSHHVTIDLRLIASAFEQFGYAQIMRQCHKRIAVAGAIGKSMPVRQIGSQQCALNRGGYIEIHDLAREALDRMDRLFHQIIVNFQLKNFIAHE